MSGRRATRQREPGAGAKTPVGDKRDRTVVAWTGLAFVLVALAGLHWLPLLRVLWFVILISGLATVPQVLVWWWQETRRRR